MTIITIGPGGGDGNVAALINAALADPATTKVVLEAGTFLLSEPIVIPSGKTLEGAGRDLTILKPAPDFTRSAPGEGEGVVNTMWNASDVTVTDFSIDADSMRPEGFRLHGLFMRGATDFRVERVDVHNATGYAHFAQGNVNANQSYASGSYEDCLTTNSQIHYEQMYANGITLTNVHAREGAGTLNGTFFHPVLGSKNISYIDSTAYGAVSAGVEVSADWILPIENIRFINVEVETFGSGAAFVAAGSSAIIGLEIVNSRFISHGNVGGIMNGTTGTIEGSYFQGEAMGLLVQTGSGIMSSIVATDSHVVALRDPLADAAAYGLGGNGDAITWIGGIVEGRGGRGLMYASGTSGVTFSPTTKLVTKGFDASVAVQEQDAPTALAPDLDFADADADYSGGKLIVSLATLVTDDERIGIAHQGDAPGEIGVDGTTLTWGGEAIGSFSGGIGAASLIVLLTEGASGEAVEALARAVTFQNLSDTPSAPSRLFSFRLLDDGGVERDQASAAAAIAAVDDPTALDLAGAELTWTRGDSATAIAPAATLADPDAPAGILLTVSLGATAQAGDILSLRDGVGGITLSGAAISHDGVEIGTFSGGSGGEPLVIELLATVTLAAAEAVVRAVTFRGPSIGPDDPRALDFTLRHTDGSEASHRVDIVVIDDSSEGSELGDTVTATAGDDAWRGLGGDDIFELWHGGTDIAHGNDGDDLFLLGASLTGADEIDGGGGADVLALQGNYALTFSELNLRGIETLAVLPGAETRFGDAGGALYAYDLTTIDANVAPGGVLLVHARDLAAGETLRFDGGAEADGAFILHGGSGDDDLSGGLGDDQLDGGAGADLLAGNGGNDLYFVDDVGDVVTEIADGGLDEIRTALGSRSDPAAMFVLPDFVENLTGTSASDQGVYGNALDNVIAMAAGNDLVVLHDGGTDRVSGGGGDDFLYFGAAFTIDDTLDGGAGFDTLGLLGNYDLTFTAASLVSVEKLAAYSSGDIAAPNHYAFATVDLNVAAGMQFIVVGMSLLAGESLTFDGSAETDGFFNLRGGRGDDSLTGGGGIDQIYGNLGADMLSGGGGADQFEYYDTAESTAASLDTILDFGAGDRVNLILMDANAGTAGNGMFAFIGDQAFGGIAGQLRIEQEEDGGWLVEGDTDGDGAADLVLRIETVGGHILSAADFWL